MLLTKSVNSEHESLERFAWQPCLVFWPNGDAEGLYGKPLLCKHGYPIVSCNTLPMIVIVSK